MESEAVTRGLIKASLSGLSVRLASRVTSLAWNPKHSARGGTSFLFFCCFKLKLCTWYTRDTVYPGFSAGAAAGVPPKLTKTQQGKNSHQHQLVGSFVLFLGFRVRSLTVATLLVVAPER
jgi:hypothetical protein